MALFYSKGINSEKILGINTKIILKNLLIFGSEFYKKISENSSNVDRQHHVSGVKYLS